MSTVFRQLLALIALASSVFAHCQDFAFARPYFERVGYGESVQGDVVTAIARTPNGLLWLGTQSGLLRYDGYRFKQYQFDPLSNNAIAGNFINALTATPDGKLWIGTANDGISIFDPDNEHFRNFRHDPAVPSSISEGSVSAFALGAEGMWVGTQNGLDLFDPKTNTFSHHPAEASDPERPQLNRIRSLLVDRVGDLWIGTWDGLRYKAKSSDVISTFASAPGVANADGFAGQVINAIFQAQDESLWIGTRQHGVARMRRGGRDIQRQMIAANDAGLSSVRVQAILQANSEEIWLATTVGIRTMDAKKLTLKQHWVSDKSSVGSLAIDAIGSMLMDSSGLIWIGTWGGGLQKTQANNRSFRTLRLDTMGNAGLSFADTHAILELKNGLIWIGTGGNGIDVFDRTRGRIGGYRNDKIDGSGLLDSLVIAMTEAPDGSVWVGTQAGGLFNGDPKTGKFQAVGAAGSVSDLLVTNDGVLWLGGSQGVSRLVDKQSTPEVVLDTDEKPVLGQINPLAQDQQGRIWAGSADGLRVLIPGEQRFRALRHLPDRADSLVHNSVFGLLVDRSGRLWVATEQGIDRMLAWSGEDSTFEHISADLGRPGQDLGANLLEDDAGRIWTDRVLLDTKQKSIYEFTRADGVDLGTTWTGAYGRTRDGLFFSGGTEGVLVIDPNRFQPWQFQPNVLPTELRINGVNAPISSLASGLRLMPGQRSFSIEFAALDFSNPQSNRYSFRLQGFDQAWINPGVGQRQASYSNLSPGEYTLIVRGSNRVGAWSSKELKIPIRVLPAFWQTGWFVVVTAFVTCAGLLLLLRWRTHRLSVRSEQLDRLVQARTAELETSNTSLLAANSALEQAQQRLIETQEKLVFQEKMASMGQLVAGVAHEVNTPLGIAVTASSFLQERSKEIAKQVETGAMRKSDLQRFASDAIESTQLLNSNLNRAVSLIGQFKQVSTQRNFDERQKIPLAQLLADAVKTLEPMCLKRGIALKYDGAPELLLDTYAGAITEVISQLLQNALIHAFAPDQSGQVTLECRVLNTSSNAIVEIVVADNGCGMTEEHCAKVFEPFFTTKRNQGSTGLGLHILFNTVTARLGGSIRILSKVGEGTRAVVQVPARLQS